MSRDRVVAMSRIRNEARWIARSLERTFQVARTVVLWDDGSDDNTEECCLELMSPYVWDVKQEYWGWVGKFDSQHGPMEIHFLHSPFRPAVRDIQNVSEIRDKNCLWEYVKARVAFDHVLCIDGDEMLSKLFVDCFSQAVSWLDEGLVDVLTVPFIYLWDREDQRRIDGIYGDSELNGRRVPFFRVPRIFTIKRLDELTLFSNRFEWEGQGAQARAGFHCGWFPRVNFCPNGEDFKGGVYPAPIIHFGYLDEAERQRKYAWYNLIDPDNEFEGRYAHIIGLPDRHAPDPVAFVKYEDT